MTRLYAAFFGVVLSLLASCAARPVRAHDAPPNVVIFFADDMGYGDLSVYGQKRYRTPRLDELAAQGVRLTEFYTAQAVCSASRAGLLTGCYPNRVGISGALGPRSAKGLDPSETTIAEVCKSRGYATAIFGKWHLGDTEGLLPIHQGFDTYFGLPYSNDMWPLHPDLVRLPADAEARKRGYPPLPLYENDTIVNPAVTPADQAMLTSRITDRALAFVEQNAAKPFFLYVPYPMPHVPLFVSPAFEGRSGAGLYGDVITEIDDSVGRIVAKIDGLGLARQTLIIFTSDNGPWLSYGDHAGTTGGLREGKGTSWEGGVREPFIARMPVRIPAGSVRSAPAMTIDVLPTVAALIGAGLPARPIDGVNLWPLLTKGDDAALRERPLAFYYNANELEAVRCGRWKLILPHSYRTLTGEPGSGGTPGPYRQVRAGMELYDLEADPLEKRDVAKENAAVVAKMTAMAERFRADLGDSLTGAEGTGRRVKR